MAQMDLPSLVKLSQVSRRLAYLISTEDGIWRQLTQNPDYGFPSMLYNFTCNIEWDRILEDMGNGEKGQINCSPLLSHPLMKPTLPLSPRYPTYRQMFRTRPRIRFNGCYISTVNYTRPGGIGSNTSTWNHNILIVTYYRYLRFFRDGTLISLLSTAEPVDVVPYLQKEYVHYQSQGGGHLPQIVMKDSLQGRWRLSGDPYGTKPRISTVEDEDVETAVEESPEIEGDVHIETEGVVPKYKYIMQLRFPSTGRIERNNRLNWVGYWCHNKLTDDVGEFGMKNYRPYYWSRVKSWY
jgi:F-box protein 9